MKGPFLTADLQVEFRPGLRRRVEIEESLHWLELNFFFLIEVKLAYNMIEVLGVEYYH